MEPLCNIQVLETLKVQFSFILNLSAVVTQLSILILPKTGCYSEVLIDPAGT